MNTTYIVDASVAIKWFLKEEERYVQEADLIYKQAREGEIILFSPEFLILEITNVLGTKKRLGKIEFVQMQRLLTASPISYLPQYELLEETVLSMLEFGLTAYDSLYVACSLKMKAPLLTQDKKILESYPQAKSLADLAS